MLKAPFSAVSVAVCPIIYPLKSKSKTLPSPRPSRAAQTFCYACVLAGCRRRPTCSQSERLLRECIQGQRHTAGGLPRRVSHIKPSGRGPVPNSSFAGAGVLICQAQAASATLPLGRSYYGRLYVRRRFASKTLWLVGGGSDCRHGTRTCRVRASRGTDCRHGASAITTARTAHGSANAAPRSSCRAGLPARRSSRRDVLSVAPGRPVINTP